VQHSKRVIKSKTIWFNLLSLVAILLADEHFRDMLGDYAIYLVVIQSLVNLGLRFVTREPLSVEVHTPKRRKPNDVLNDALNKEQDYLKDF